MTGLRSNAELTRTSLFRFWPFLVVRSLAYLLSVVKSLLISFVVVVVEGGPRIDINGAWSLAETAEPLSQVDLRIVSRLLL